MKDSILAKAIAIVTLASACAFAQAAAFTAGNVVVYRVGSGSGSLVNTGSAVFMDEYTSAGALVQSVALPTSASGSNAPLIASGTATSEGLLSRSADGQYLVATGYGRAIGGSGSLSGTTAAAVPRVVGRIDFNGSVDTSTALTDFADGNNPRSVTSNDGSAFWVTGGAGGVRYASFGATTSTQLSTTQTNLRQAAIFGAQLYVDTGSGTTKTVGSVGSGLPTSSGQTISFLPGTPASGSPYAFVLLDLDAGVAGVDTLYLVDDSAGLEKFSLVGGTWSSNGTIGTATDVYRGLTASVNGSTVTLYAVRKGGGGATGGGELVSLVDGSGYNGALAGTPTLLATAAANTAFRGVALAPRQVVATPPAITGLADAFSGVLNDVTDYAATSGLPFSVSDSATPACNIAVTLASSNPAVVPTTGVTLSGCNGGAYAVKIAPIAVGFSDITLTATNAGNVQATAVVHFAASAPGVAPGALETTWPVGEADASTAQPIDAYTTIVGEDENQVLRVYSRLDSGPAVAAFDVSASLGLDPSDPEVDIESSVMDAVVPYRIYWSSSHGNSKSGNLKPNRNRIFATDLVTSSTGGLVTVTGVNVLGYYEHLRDDLIAWDQNNGHGLGANYLGLAASAAAGIPPKKPDGSGFNIEGLALAPDGSTMWLGFRAPLLPTTARTRALLVPVTNFAALAEGVMGHSAGQAQFDAPVLLDLGGRGIRELRCVASGCLIEAGAVDGTPNAALYTWSGNAADTPVLRSANVSGLNPEGVVELPAGGLTDTSVLEIVSDEGGADFYATGTDAKDLAHDNWKKFRIDSVALGTRVPANIAANGNSAQSALIRTAFGNPLKAVVSDANHAPIAGASVTFSAPATGQSLVFAATSSSSETVVTDASGIATSSVATANAIPGTYGVTAAVSGGPSVSIGMSNLAPQAQLSTSSLQFDSVRYGNSAIKQVDVQNIGTAQLHVGQVDTDGDFTVTASTCDQPVAVQGSCTISIAFTPRALGQRSGTLTIASDSYLATGSVTLAGSGTQAQIALQLSNDDGVRLIQPGQSVSYHIVLNNTGPDAAHQVALQDNFSAPLTNCNFTSSATGGATGNSTGPAAGNIADSLDLPAGSSVAYTATCFVPANAVAGTLTNQAALTVGPLYDNSAGNATAADSDTIVVDVIFRDSFET